MRCRYQRGEQGERCFADPVERPGADPGGSTSARVVRDDLNLLHGLGSERFDQRTLDRFHAAPSQLTAGTAALGRGRIRLDRDLRLAPLPDPVREFGHQAAELRGQFGAATLEMDLGEFQVDPLGRRRQGHQLDAEVEATHQARRHARHAGVVGRQARSGRKARRIQLHDEVPAAFHEASIDSGNVISTEGVGFDHESLDGREPHAGDAILARILPAIAVTVVEDLADDRRLVEHRVSHDRDLADVRVADRESQEERRGGVRVFTPHHASADPQHIPQGAPLPGCQVDSGEHQRARPAQAESRGLAVQPDAARDEAEAPRRGVANFDAGETRVGRVLERDGVRHQATDSRRRTVHALAQADGGRLEVRRIQRDVVVDDVRIALREIQHEVMRRRLPIGGRHRLRLDLQHTT